MSEALFKRLSAENTGVNFSNDIRQTDSQNVLEYMYFYNGGGVGVGDINNDGLTDIFLSGNMVSSRLYVNKGNLRFEDITGQAGVATTGWCTGVAMVDINNDGFLDIYVSRAGSQNPHDRANLLFINQGNNTFTELASAYGIADTGYTTQGAFFDYDKDGYLDLYLLTHDHAPQALNVPSPVKENGEGKSTDKLYRNNGNSSESEHPTFTDVSAKAGILIEGYGLGVGINDINADGWPDIYVSNDFLSSDLLYINNRNGTFSNKISDFVKHQSYNSMGVDVSDYNNDGLSDIFVVDMLPEDNYRQKTMSGGMTNEKFDFMLQRGYEPQYMRNTLQLNNGNGHFSEIGRLAGIEKTDWSWSPLFADFDNDGYKDLFITNGYLKDITDKDFISYSKNKTMFKDEQDANKTLLALMDEQAGVQIPNYAYKNNHNLTFSKAEDWGFDQPTYSNGAAYADLDNDGDLDLVINNINEKASVYENKTEQRTANHYLALTLHGDLPNPMGLGTQVILRNQGQVQLYEHTLYRGYQSTVSNIVHFGLGEAQRVDTVEIHWADGRQQQFFNVPANQLMTVRQEDARYPSEKENNEVKAVFSEVSKELGIDFLHQENSYSDLIAYPLLPQTYSSLGPSLAAGDIDGNGLEDVFMGGSAGNPGSLFLQQSSGKFTRREFRQDVEFEDMGALLFDADQDGDLDLYVVSGGSESSADSSLYQDRLYSNDGRGSFQRDMSALPTINSSGACVTAADFDRDGDLDVFVGGRVLPGSYPQAPESYILQNDGGTFTNVTEEVCFGLKNIGMVTSALWTDFDNDNQVDLLVVGEWMPITFFKNVKGKLVNVTTATGLGETSGWWNSLAGGDMDNDGDIDYVLGNLGLNTPFKASEDKPLTIYSGDFDGSSTPHTLLSWYKQGENYPMASRDLLLRQMPGFGKRFMKYHDYARATVEDIILPEALEQTLVLQSSYFSTAYLENQGEGKFSLRPLPLQAQVAPVNGILVKDVDYDGNLDILMTGNSYAPDVAIGRYDAFAGLYLKGDGRGSFSPVALSQSGFFIDSDAKSLNQLYTQTGDALILGAANADSLKAYLHTIPERIRLLKPHSQDAFATFKIPGSGNRKVEFYYGSGYLSQSSRMLEIPEEAELLEIVDFEGNGRILDSTKFQ
uniref:VCBS repeat-containing protein n=1 Tax=Roseihalotalea indica TaxID=2867963 RepID=A0AA49GJU0_9BACT|nr:VCBS repeat-containing protein [Tunicatimonas sp. TK19036]